MKTKHPLVSVEETVLGVPTLIDCIISEHIDPASGDYSMFVDIGEMVAKESGQTVLPGMLSNDEFRSLMRKLSQRVTL